MGNTFDRIPIKEQARGIVSAQRSTCALACLVIALLALLPLFVVESVKAVKRGKGSRL